MTDANDDNMQDVAAEAPSPVALFETRRGFYLALLSLVIAFAGFCGLMQVLPMELTVYVVVILTLSWIWLCLAMYLDGRRRGARRMAMAFVVAIALTVVYVGSYFVMMYGTGQFILSISNPSSDTAPVAPRPVKPVARKHGPYLDYPGSMFPLYRIDSRVVEVLFYPAHDIDRTVLRRAYWH